MGLGHGPMTDPFRAGCAVGLLGALAFVAAGAEGPFGALPAPLLVWGLTQRAVGALQAVSLASLASQVAALAGSRGISPAALQLAAIRRDFPGVRRFFYFPTVLWLGSGDAALRLLPLMGAIAGAVAMVGGPLSALARLVAHGSLVSLDSVLDLNYPWDCVLFELGLLALLLPAGLPVLDPAVGLASAAASAPPSPLVAWCFRWLAFRVLLGFGKMHFRGKRHEDRAYIKNFLVFQPIPSTAGYVAQRLPAAVFVGALGFMWVAEVVLPFWFFAGGAARVIAAAVCALLMVGIQVCGNYGHFNMVTLASLLPMLDSESCVRRRDIWDAASSADGAATLAIVAALAVGGIIYLPFNSWVSQSWLHWPTVSRPLRRKWLQLLVEAYRFLVPFRVMHAYGVFFPVSGPAVRYIPVIEGSDDGGKSWRTYEYRWQPCTEHSAPCVVAPHHPRLDHAIFYEARAYDVCGCSNLRSSLSTRNPYRFTRHGTLERIMQRLMEGSAPVLSLFRHNPFPRTPPVLARVTMHMLEPAEWQDSGNRWWRKTRLHTHLLPRGRDDGLWERWLPTPELFHVDMQLWRNRAPALRVLDSLGGSSGLLPAILDADQTALPGVAVDPIRTPDVQFFWEWLVPQIGAQPNRRHEQWAALEADALRMHAGASRRERRENWTCDESCRPKDRLRKLERVLGKLTAALLRKLEPHLLGLAEPQLRLLSHFHLGQLTHLAILRGRDCYRACLADPGGRGTQLAAELRGSKATVREAAAFTAFFWRPQLRQHAKVHRIALQEARGRPGHSDPAPAGDALALNPGYDAWAQALPVAEFGDGKDDVPTYELTEQGAWTVRHRDGAARTDGVLKME